MMMKLIELKYEILVHHLMIVLKMMIQFQRNLVKIRFWNSLNPLMLLLLLVIQISHRRWNFLGRKYKNNLVLSIRVLNV